GGVAVITNTSDSNGLTLASSNATVGFNLTNIGGPVTTSSVVSVGSSQFFTFVNSITAPGISTTGNGVFSGQKVVLNGLAGSVNATTQTDILTATGGGSVNITNTSDNAGLTLVNTVVGTNTLNNFGGTGFTLINTGGPVTAAGAVGSGGTTSITASGGTTNPGIFTSGTGTFNG